MSREYSDKQSAEPSFPIGWLTVIMVFELALIGVSVWLIGYTEVRVREGMKRQVRLERLHGDIVHLDEVLTMSAKMGAASGDPKWEKRYLKYEPLLDVKIRDVMAEAEVLARSDGARRERGCQGPEGNKIQRRGPRLVRSQP